MVSDLPFNALADPVRRQLLAVLSERGECSAGDLAEAVDRVSRTSVSGHLRILLQAGLIGDRREGRFRYFYVEPAGPAKDVIRALQQLFSVSLDDLEASLVEGRSDSQPERRVS